VAAHRVGSPGTTRRGHGARDQVASQNDIYAINCFLEEAKGIANMDPSLWDAELERRRFSYIERRAATSQREAEGSMELGAGKGNIVSWEQRGLPFLQYSIRDMHELLMSGSVPQLQQMEAHVFCPDKVPWPKPKGEKVETPPHPPTPPKGDSGPGTRPGAPAAPGGMRASQPDNGEEDQEKSLAQSASDKGLAMVKANSIVELEDDQKAEFARCAKFLRGAANQSSKNEDEDPEIKDALGDLNNNPEELLQDTSTGVRLRGQLLRLTAKGNPIVGGAGDIRLGNKEKGLDPSLLTEEELLGEELQAETAFGREERKRMMREAQLLEYREKKVIEKIRQLTEERDRELVLQKGLTSKENQRRVRTDQLKKRLLENTQRVEQKEAEEKRKKEEEAAARRKEEKKEKERQAERRREVEDWQEKKLRGEIPTRRATPEMPQKPEKPKTQRQIEAEEYARALHAALEQRPPMGELPKRPGARRLRPAASGYAYPSMEQREGGDASTLAPGSSGTKSGSPSGRSKEDRGDWVKQTKQVSDAYGLSDDEFAVVQEIAVRGVTDVVITSDGKYENKVAKYGI